MGLTANYIERFAVWLTPDLETYLGVQGNMFAEIEFYAFDVFDENDDFVRDGWVVLYDPDLAPAKDLPHLAQYVGEILPVGISEAAQREWIKDAPSQLRGTPYSIFRAAQRFLTGQRTVLMRERDNGDGSDSPDYMLVKTFATETPNAAAVEAEIRTVLPADVILNYQAIIGQSWADVAAGHATWNDVAVAYADWAEVQSDLPEGYVTFSRPLS